MSLQARPALTLLVQTARSRTDLTGRLHAPLLNSQQKGPRQLSLLSACPPPPSWGAPPSNEQPTAGTCGPAAPGGHRSRKWSFRWPPAQEGLCERDPSAGSSAARQAQKSPQWAQGFPNVTAPRPGPPSDDRGAGSTCFPFYTPGGRQARGPCAGAERAGWGARRAHGRARVARGRFWKACSAEPGRDVGSQPWRGFFPRRTVEAEGGHEESFLI